MTPPAFTPVVTRDDRDSCRAHVPRHAPNLCPHDPARQAPSRSEKQQGPRSTAPRPLPTRSPYRSRGPRGITTLRAGSPSGRCRVVCVRLIRRVPERAEPNLLEKSVRSGLRHVDRAGVRIRLQSSEPLRRPVFDLRLTDRVPALLELLHEPRNLAVYAVVSPAPIRPLAALRLARTPVPANRVDRDSIVAHRSPRWFGAEPHARLPCHQRTTYQLGSGAPTASRGTDRRSLPDASISA